MKTLLRCVAAALLATSASWAVAQTAQNFPNRALRMVIHFPPGGPTDIMGRLAADILQFAARLLA